MKTVFLILGFLTASYASELHLRTQFNEFVKKYNKEYSSPAHFEERLAIFAENLREIQEHNLQSHSWKKGINQFADLTRNYTLYLF